LKIAQVVEPLGEKLRLAKFDHLTIVARWLHLVNTTWAAGSPPLPVNET
jgi:hypothetical protein